MKKIIISMALIVMLGVFTNAQNVNFIQKTGVSFQGYARNDEGAALSGKKVTVKFTVYENNKPSAYEQEILVTTDAFGVFRAIIGEGGTNLKGKFQDLKFSLVNYKLKVEVKPSGGSYVIISDQFLKSVPYAHAAPGMAPVGAMMPFAGPKANIPDGWMLCDGSKVSKNEYPKLHDAIGYSWGGSGNDFYLPETRGFFLRGVSHGTARDNGRDNRHAIRTGGNRGDKVGSAEYEEVGPHKHYVNFSTRSAGSHSHKMDVTNAEVEDQGWPKNGNRALKTTDRHHGATKWTHGVGDHTHKVEGWTNNNSGKETRPENVYVNYIIRVK